METLNNLLENHADEPVCRSFCRIRTSMWGDRRGIYLKKSVTFLRKRSIEGGYFEHDVDMVGPDEVFLRIVNLNECEDGIYEVVTVNPHCDWETGTLDDYDYKLIAIETENQK